MEVAVVGAGPAGSTCAEILAARGHRVVIFDPSHPREKPCGGGVTPGVFERHPHLAPLRELGRAAARVRLSGPRSASVEVALPAPIHIFSREALDGALLDRALAAGARLEARRVRGVRVEREAAWLRAGADAGEERFDAVVGADGAASAVRRALVGTRPGGPAGYATAGFHVEGLPEDEIFVEFLPDMRGYLWAFPRAGHASVGIAAPVGALGGRALSERVAELLRRAYPGSAGLPRQRYAASIPSPTGVQARRDVVAGARWGLVGDAASQVDAITGEGIHYAIDAGILLAHCLAAHGAEEGPQRYARAWAAGPGRELAIAARWTGRYYRPAVVDALLQLGERSRRGRAVMADLLAVVQPYSRLRRRLAREIWSGPRRAGRRSRHPAPRAVVEPGKEGPR